MRQNEKSHTTTSASTAGFFDLPTLNVCMSPLRDALQELPSAVFADLLESADAYLVVLDLPGVTADTTTLSVDRGRLSVEARREKDLPSDEDFRYIREERSLFLDVDLPLPPDATGSGASAEMERGVLAITLPKRDAAPDQTIPISSPEGA
jgi:HSP20 family molecular chaperone IbpA